MPAPLKERVYRLMDQALAGSDREFAYLPATERKVIREILVETLPDFVAAMNTPKTSSVR